VCLLKVNLSLQLYSRPAVRTFRGGSRIEGVSFTATQGTTGTNVFTLNVHTNCG
jgi:hypothetical protein